MERIVSLVLNTFSVGFILIGVVIGLLKVDTDQYCGAVLWHEEGCSQPVSMLAAMIGLFGLAVTCWVAASVVLRSSRPADPPVVHPDGAQV
jgi:hypothetical protein